jgi:hypothetical protein
MRNDDQVPAHPNTPDDVCELCTRSIELDISFQARLRDTASLNSGWLCQTQHQKNPRPEASSTRGKVK